MNYYERHIGDYLKDTAHLSLLEHGVYTRLIDVYYTREGAIPEREVARLIAARSKDEREALAAVLAEFFVLIDGAYSQKRCEEELHHYREGQEGAEDKKVNDKERQRRARERRKALFEELRGHGVVPPWDAKTGDLQTMLSRVTNTDSSRPVTQLVTCDNTASQAPVPSNQKPEIQGARPDATTSRALVEGEFEPDNPVEGAGTRYGLAAKAMRQRGCAANPGDPRLRELVDQGASLEEFEAVGAEAADKGKGAAWALTALINRRKDAAEIRLAPTAAAPEWHDTRAGLSSRAQQLGIDAWPQVEQESIRRGQRPDFDAYRRRVIKADEAAQETTR